MLRPFIFLTLAGFAMGAGNLVTPIDPAKQTEVRDALQSAVREGDSAAVINQGRRMLELYPNEPILHASLYRVMSEAARQSGDEDRAAQFAAVAKKLDPAPIALAATSV